MYKLIGVVTLGLVFCLAGCGKTGTDTKAKPKDKPAATTKAGCKCEKGKEGTSKDCKCTEAEKKASAKCCGCDKKGEKAPAPKEENK